MHNWIEIGNSEKLQYWKIVFSDNKLTSKTPRPDLRKNYLQKQVGD